MSSLQRAEVTQSLLRKEVKWNAFLDSFSGEEDGAGQGVLIQDKAPGWLGQDCRNGVVLLTA